MTLREEKYDRAKELYGQGFSYEAIARKLGVSSRTVYRWLRTETRPRKKRLDTNDWPSERQWPDWTMEELNQKIGWLKEEAEAELAGIRTAQELGNYHYPWYMRRMVETVERFGASHRKGDKIDLWLLSIAGLPVLGDWLGGCAECDTLSDLIEQYRPWEDKRSLRAYSQDAQSLAGPIKQRILMAITDWNLKSAQKGMMGPGLQESPPLILQALSQRIPTFDKVPLLSPFRLYRMGHIFAKLFIFPKGGPR